MPDYTDLFFELALCAQAAGENDEAERLLRHCLELGDAPRALRGDGRHRIAPRPRRARRAGRGPGPTPRRSRCTARGLALQPAFTATVLPLAKLLLKHGARPAESPPSCRSNARPLRCSRRPPTSRPATPPRPRSSIATCSPRQPGTGAARMGVLQALLAQRRYEEAAAEAASEPALADGAARGRGRMFACAALRDPARSARRRARGAAGCRAGEVELYRAWAARLAERGELPTAGARAGARALEALLRARDSTTSGGW